MDSVGKPQSRVEVKIDNSNGEILMRGPFLMDGYYKRKELTDQTLRGGWLHTGDKGFIDKDSYLHITGRVASVGDVIKTSTVAIAPMQSGSGMQIKILEAMACGVPVVATSLGLGDIKAVPESDILIGDSPEDFTEMVIRLIRSEELNQYVGNNGLKFVESNHSWDSINERFLTRMNKLIRRKS